MGVRCFLLDPLPLTRVGLRRYVCRTDGTATCPARQWGCDSGCRWLFYAESYKISSPTNPRDWLYADHWISDLSIPRTHPLWPTTCEGCQQPLPEEACWQIFRTHAYQRRDTGEILTLRDAPPGAMWDAEWMSDWWKGLDGRAMTVKCPNGHEWIIDGRASNCDSPCKVCSVPYHAHQTATQGHPYKDARPDHRCWVRHGEPPLLVVDKSGVTCGAGAGSIMAGNYHGFLGTCGAPPGEFTGSI